MSEAIGLPLNAMRCGLCYQQNSCDRSVLMLKYYVVFWFIPFLLLTSCASVQNDPMTKYRQIEAQQAEAAEQRFQEGHRKTQQKLQENKAEQEKLVQRIREFTLPENYKDIIDAYFVNNL